MKKVSQILAIIGIVLLVSLYIATLVAACFASPASNGLFMASLYSTFAIPVLIWVCRMFYNLSQKRKNDENTP